MNNLIPAGRRSGQREYIRYLMDINGSRAEAHLNLLHRVTVQTPNPPPPPQPLPSHPLPHPTPHPLSTPHLLRCRNSHVPPLLLRTNVDNKKLNFHPSTYNHVDTPVKKKFLDACVFVMHFVAPYESVLSWQGQFILVLNIQPHAARAALFSAAAYWMFQQNDLLHHREQELPTWMYMNVRLSFYW